jgi:ribulose-5-phosphate 4-epimerase/fuculose-1-phosphate aldolase
MTELTHAESWAIYRQIRREVPDLFVSFEGQPWRRNSEGHLYRRNARGEKMTVTPSGVRLRDWRGQTTFFDLEE